MGLHQLKRAADLVAEARRGITRLTPEEAYAAWQDGALLVDTRTEDQLEDGLIDGATRHAYSVFPWRIDDLPRDTRLIVLCRHGESSSFAAAQAKALGFSDVSDVIGGAEAWRRAGLPVTGAGAGDQVV